MSPENSLTEKVKNYFSIYQTLSYFFLSSGQAWSNDVQLDIIYARTRVQEPFLRPIDQKISNIFKKMRFQVFIIISDEFGSLLMKKVLKTSDCSLAFEKLFLFNFD